MGWWLKLVHWTDSREDASYWREGYRHLDDEQGERAQALLQALANPNKKSRRQAKPAPRPVVVSIPIESGKVEAYDTKTTKEVVRARREETKLVSDFAAYLAKQGDSVCRHKITVTGAGGPLYSDLYNETREQLIEAKAGTSRGDVRMAIGQLADYARMIDPPPRCAVLLEARPAQELIDLLHSQNIVAIWRDGSGFTDNVDQAFT